MTGVLLGRTLLALGLVAVGFGVYWLVNRLFLRRVRGRYLGLDDRRPGIPAILYFTAPGCQPCKTVQRPALESLQAALGERIQIVEVDAVQHPDLADYWGVLSLPTTFVIDSNGEPRRVNHGVARAEKLLSQLEAVEGKPLTVAPIMSRIGSPSANRLRRP